MAKNIWDGPTTLEDCANTDYLFIYRATFDCPTDICECFMRTAKILDGMFDYNPLPNAVFGSGINSNTSARLLWMVCDPAGYAKAKGNMVLNAPGWNSKATWGDVHDKPHDLSSPQAKNIEGFLNK